jgi:hypothetical protein
MINPIQESLRIALNDPDLVVSTEPFDNQHFLLIWVTPKNKKAKISFTVPHPKLKQDGEPRALSSRQVQFIVSAATAYIKEHEGAK